MTPVDVAALWERFRDHLEAIIDIWDDGRNLAPENRGYVPDALNNEIEDARATLKAFYLPQSALPQPQEDGMAACWIPVTERLPTDDTPVFVRHENGDVGFDIYEDGGWTGYESAMEAYRTIACDEMINGVTPVTHWFPEPALQSGHAPQEDGLRHALTLAAQWIESEEGHTLQYVVESEDRSIARVGKGAWNKDFAAMARAVTAALPVRQEDGQGGVDSASASSGGIVGHKTFSDGHGGFRHEPLTRDEGNALLAAIDAADAKRAADMPDEATALRVMFSAYQRLRDLGWKEAMYCPKDGTYFDAIEAGSTGIHDCTYHGEWPTGGWWVASENDLCPSHPILYRLRATALQSGHALKTTPEPNPQNAAADKGVEQDYVRVPREPTDEMLRAGHAEMFVDVRYSRVAKIVRRGYKAMLLATPDHSEG